MEEARYCDGQEDDADEIIDDWETAADSGILDDRIDKLPLALSPTGVREKEVSGQVASAEANVDIMAQQQQIHLVEDTVRTTYQPTIKILKRTDDGARNCNVDQTKDQKVPRETTTQYKSLEERERIYREARRRILGSSESDKEPVT